MKSLICSDVHDRLSNLEEALKVADAAGCDSVLCCGDLCSPFVLDHFHEFWSKPLHVVFGNNDGDRFGMSKKAQLLNRKRSKNGQIYLHGDYLLAPKGHNMAGIPGKVTLAMYHYPEPAFYMAASGMLRYVFFGHTHRTFLEDENGCLLANPGSLMGYIPGNRGASRWVAPTCLIINWGNGEADLIQL